MQQQKKWIGNDPPAPPSEILQKFIHFGVDAGEQVKYYFADFVRKGGTPPPLRTKILPKKSYGFGGYPPPPFTDKIRKVVFDHLP